MPALLSEPLIGADWPSMRRPTPEQVAITVLRHPLRAGQVALPGPAGSLRLACWIDVEDNTSYFTPLSRIRLRVEETEIGDQVLLVVCRERVLVRRLIGDIRIRWKFAH
jgi:hypothetical protein